MGYATLKKFFSFQVQSTLMVEKRNIFEQELDKEVKVCAVEV
jgi:hypothetical protein